MSAIEMFAGATEPIGLRLRRRSTLITGATVRARVLRTSDSKELDWSDNTFKTAGSAVMPRQNLTESPASSAVYSHAWNTALITNAVAPDTYLVQFDETSPEVRELRQDEVRIRAINLLARPGDQMALVTSAISAAKIASAAITSAAFAADAIDANAVATSAVNEIANASREATLNATAASYDVPGTIGERINNADVDVSTRAATGAQMNLVDGAITTAKFAANAIDSTVLATDAIGSAQLAASAITEIQSGLATSAAVAAVPTTVWQALVPGSFTLGQAGYVLGTNLDTVVSSRASTDDVNDARDAIRGSDSLDLTLIGGPAFNTAVNSLVALTTRFNMVDQAIDDIENSTSFSATIPTLQRPAASDPPLDYVIRVNIDGPTGGPVDPDGNTITVGVTNAVDTDRSDHLSSTTMTRIGLGRYEVTYTVNDTDALEQVIFTFSYDLSGVPNVRDRTTNIVDVNVSAFTSADRATLGEIFADTDFIEQRVNANLDVAVSTRATNAGAATAVWVEPTRTLTGIGASGIASSAELTARIDEIKGSPWNAGTDNLHDIYNQAHGGMMLTTAFQIAALASIAAVPEEVWAALINDNMNAGSTGEALFAASRAPTVGSIATEVWNTVEMGDPGTFGYGNKLMRQFITNRTEEAPGNPGQLTLYADNGSTQLLRWALRDGSGGAVISTAGQPARRGAAT